MFSKDFKRMSLSQLGGKWGQVIIALLCATLISGVVSLIYSATNNSFDFWQNHTTGLFSFGFLLSSALLALVMLCISIIVNGCMQYGRANYTLNFVRYGETNISYIFSGFSYGINTILRSAALGLLIALFTLLWSCLFIIPGIIASFAYSQAFYILADNDNISPYEAIKLSREMMRGHKWKLFCLMLSFIGWILLSCITFGIGFIFLQPYMETAYTNFYEYIRGVYDNRMGVNI